VRAAWALAPAALGGLVAMLVAGCSCNTTNSFDDQYCNAYANTPVPAFLVGVVFFAGLFLLIAAFQRLTRPAPSGRAAGRSASSSSVPAGPPWQVRGLEARAASHVLADLADLGVDVKASERFDGAWLIEIRVPRADPPFAYVGTWGPRETGGRDALRAMRERGLVQDAGDGATESGAGGGTASADGSAR
jgi:hypothetical protein